MDSRDELLTSKEVCALFKVTGYTLMRWAREGKITYTLTPGGRRRYPRVEVERILDQGRVTVNHDAATVNYGSEFSSLTDD